MATKKSATKKVAAKKVGKPTVKKTVKKPVVKKVEETRKRAVVRAKKTTTAKSPKITFSGNPRNQPDFKKMKLNENMALRDEKLAPYFYDYDFAPGRKMEKVTPGKPSYTDGYSARFENVPLAMMQTLIEDRFMNPTARHNKAPAIQQFINFMTLYPEATAHGYVVHTDFEDYGIEIEGLMVTKDAWAQMPKPRREVFLRDFKRFGVAAGECGPGTNDNVYWSWFD